MDALPTLSPKSDVKDPLILFIGKEFYRKGGDVLLRSFNSVRQSFPKARLTMITSDPVPGGLDMEHVEIVSPTWDRSTIFKSFQEADIFVLPSRLETWGDVLLEAMAFGLPCIGTAGDAMNEIIEDGTTGYIVQPENVDVLTARLQELVSDAELRKRFGTAGRKRVERLFTWEKVVERISPVITTSIQASSNLIGRYAEQA